MAEATRPVTVPLVQGMLSGVQRLLFPSHTPSFVPGIEEEWACVAWCGAKENSEGFWKGKRSKQRAIPGAARAGGHAEEVLLQAARSAGDPAARGKSGEDFSIPAFPPGMRLTRCLKKKEFAVLEPRNSPKFGLVAAIGAPVPGCESHGTFPAATIKHGLINYKWP